MISKTEIRNDTNTTTYRRGNEVFLAGKIHGMTITDVDDPMVGDALEIKAIADGSYGNQYRVKVRLSEQESEILDYSCDCPAARKYWGLCKHGVAALFSYLEWRKREQKKEEESLRQKKDTEGISSEYTGQLDLMMSRMGVSKGSLPVTVQKTSSQNMKAARTTEGFSGMMARYAMKEKAEWMPKVQAGQVVLEPFIDFYSDEKAQAEFKIGISRPYVLKSVSKLAASIHNLEQKSYGAQLSFVHCMEAFHPDSLPLVKFILNYCDEMNLCYKSRSGEYYSYLDDRRIQLDKKNIIALFQSLTGRTVSVADYGMKAEEVCVEQGMPDLTLKLEGCRGGIRMSLPPWKYIRAGNGALFFRNQKILVADAKSQEEPGDFLDFLLGQQGGTCEIAEDDLPAFCQELLPVLEKHMNIEHDSVELSIYMPTEASFVSYLDAPQKDMITCELYACYGDQKYPVFSDINAITRMAKGRDMKRESRANAMARKYFSSYDMKNKQMVLTGPDEMYAFLAEGLDAFRNLGEVYVSDRLKAVRIVSAPKVSVGVTMSQNLLELDISGNGFPMDELAQILSRYDKRKKYFRLKSGDFVDMDDDGVRVLSELKESLDLREGVLKTGHIELPKFRALYLDNTLSEQEGVTVTKARDFRTLIRNMKTIEDNDYEIPVQLKAELRGYQKKGYRWIRTLCANGFGGILADDMGLGKTLQIITFLLGIYEESRNTAEQERSLVICPASLVYNWQNEFETFAPSLPVCCVTGTAAERKEILAGSGPGDILITSYELLRRDLKLYQPMSFFCEVLDEAQFIKNHSTQGAKAVKQITAKFRMALTGTPVENSLSELWSIFDYLMPGFLLGYSKFRDQYEVPIVKNQQEEPLLRLQKMIRPFVLRRLKKDVLKDLPDKLEKVMAAPMDGQQKELYDAHVQRLAMQLHKQTREEFEDSRFQVLSELTHLRQLCCDPSLLYADYDGGSAKLDLCLELIKNAIDGGHKILLFSQFTSMLELIQQSLTEEGIAWYLLNGSTSKEKRAELVKKFNSDDTPVFCISLKAGGTGLNLTGADIVIHYDPWWNAAVENQATDRAHRIGQKSQVTVYKLITKGTIEEKIVALQGRKQELADQVLSGDGLKNPTFSREELLELLQ